MSDYLGALARRALLAPALRPRVASRFEDAAGWPRPTAPIQPTSVGQPHATGLARTVPLAAGATAPRGASDTAPDPGPDRPSDRPVAATKVPAPPGPVEPLLRTEPPVRSAAARVNAPERVGTTEPLPAALTAGVPPAPVQPPAAWATRHAATRGMTPSPRAPAPDPGVAERTGPADWRRLIESRVIERLEAAPVRAQPVAAAPAAARPLPTPPPAAPRIDIHIGRIEVLPPSSVPDPAPRDRTIAKQPAQSLEAYLNSRRSS